MHSTHSRIPNSTLRGDFTPGFSQKRRDFPPVILYDERVNSARFPILARGSAVCLGKLRYFRVSYKVTECVKMNYQIITDSCCDFPAELYRELNLEFVPLTVEFRG